MDTVTKVLIEMIGNTGYEVSITYDGNAKPVVTAVDKRTRETFIVRHEDLYLAACELAEQVGIELEDGYILPQYQRYPATATMSMPLSRSTPRVQLHPAWLRVSR